MVEWMDRERSAKTRERGRPSIGMDEAYGKSDNNCDNRRPSRLIRHFLPIKIFVFFPFFFFYNLDTSQSLYIQFLFIFATLKYAFYLHLLGYHDLLTFLSCDQHSIIVLRYYVKRIYALIDLKALLYHFSQNMYLCRYYNWLIHLLKSLTLLYIPKTCVND